MNKLYLASRYTHGVTANHIHIQLIVDLKKNYYREETVLLTLCSSRVNWSVNNVLKLSVAIKLSKYLTRLKKGLLRFTTVTVATHQQPGPNFIELLQRKILLAIFQLSKNKQDTSCTCDMLFWLVTLFWKA